MASSLEKIDTELFLEMYDRIGTNVQYFVLTKVHDNANPFTKNIFHFHSEDYAFEFKRLLKKPKPKVQTMSLSENSERWRDTTRSATSGYRRILKAVRGGSTDLTDAGDSRALNQTGDSADLTKPGESTQLGGEDSRDESKSGSSVPIKKVKLTVQDEDELDTDSDEFKAALHKLNEALKEENMKAMKSLVRKENETLSEDSILVCVGNHLISNLAGKAVTSKTKSKLSCPCGCNKKLLAEEKMYIGSEDTWHGELDLFALCRQQSMGDGIVGIFAARNHEQGEGDVGTHDIADDGDTEGDSQGESTNSEFQKRINPPDKVQAIGQAIVCGWTEYNRHKAKHKSPYIPFIYIDKQEYLFFIYNPELDTLISSVNYIKYFYEKAPPDLPKDIYSGVFILWIILHHRLFFRKKILGGFNLECGFTRQLSRESIQAYNELKDFALFVQDKEKDYDQWGHEPQMKRRMIEEMW